MTSMITLTGADERTDIEQLLAFVNSNVFVEIGVLYTATPDGRNRYPSKVWIEQLLHLLRGRGALHVCGAGARRQLLAGELRRLTRHVTRVPVNGFITPHEAVQLASVVPNLITQHNGFNADLVGLAIPNHSLLVDSSGGRGISPKLWIAPECPSKPVGFAGGMGPDNLAAELHQISPLSTQTTWVDMESRIRTNDWFDLALANRCAQIFTEFNQQSHFRHAATAATA